MKNNILYFSLLVTLCSACKSSMSLSESGQSAKEARLMATIDSLEQELLKMKQSTTSEAVFEPGKRYSSCAIAPQFEIIDSVSYWVYLGTDSLQKGIEHIQLMTRPSYLEWEHILEGKVCDGEEFDYSECDLWFYKEVAATWEVIPVVRDIYSVKDYERRTYYIEGLLKNGTLTKRHHVICPTVCSSNLAAAVQTALRKKGYDLRSAEKNKFDKITKAALVSYQIKNGLPQGQLDYETLVSLGIKQQ